MHRWGHVGAALAAYAPVALVAAALGLDDLLVLGAVAAAGLSMLPDVDLRLPLVPHRGPTHTVWFALLVAAGGAAVGWNAGAPTGAHAAVGLAGFGAVVSGLAVASHLAADALTPMGVRPLAPLSGRHVSLNLTPSANPVANWLGLGAGVALALGAVTLGRWLAATWTGLAG